jgi:hypothetical protein
VCRALAAHRHLGAFLDRVGDVHLEISIAFMSISGPITIPASKAISTFIAPALREGAGAPAPAQTGRNSL